MSEISLNNKLSLLFSKRMLIILVLGFASGLPLSLCFTTLQAWYKSAGVDYKTIGYLALLGTPYSFKFLWSPLIDYFQIKGFERYQGWMMVSQIAIIFTLLAMSYLNPYDTPKMLALAALFLAFFSATQDLAYDAFKTASLLPKERGIGAAIGVEGYRIAMIFSGGLGLVIADHFSWKVTYQIMAIFMLLGLVASYYAVEPSITNGKIAVTKPSILPLVKNCWLDFLGRKNSLLFLLLIVFYKLGDAFSNAQITPFLLDLNFSLTEIGYIVKVVGAISTLLGIFFGGLLIAKFGLYQSLLFFGILQALTNFTYMIVAIIGKNYSVAISAMFLEHICGGMGTAAFTALLMSLCNLKYSATQYALLTSVMSTGRIFLAGPISGHLIENYGWQNYYFLTVLIAMPGILLVIYLKDSILRYDHTSSKPANLVETYSSSNSSNHATVGN